MFEYKNTRFHLVARTRDYKDVVLFDFNEEYNFSYYMSQVDPEIYQSASILECKNGLPPINRMSREFRDNTPYFKKYKKRELKKGSEEK